MARSRIEKLAIDKACQRFHRSDQKNIVIAVKAIIRAGLLIVGFCEDCQSFRDRDGRTLCTVTKFPTQPDAYCSDFKPRGE